MKRLLDVVLSLFCLILSIPICIIIYIAVRLTSAGPGLYWSTRMGKNHVKFRMPKFRTMLVDTPELASHLIDDPQYWITPLGKFLRRSSLDELPQLLSVIRGDMSLVGPRPALHTQHDLILARERNNLTGLLPGITGWAQINGRDSISIQEKVRLDAIYANRQSIIFDVYILGLTVIAIIRRKGISH